jgi:hypothetical protein
MTLLHGWHVHAVDYDQATRLNNPHQLRYDESEVLVKLIVGSRISHVSL